MSVFVGVISFDGGSFVSGVFSDPAQAREVLASHAIMFLAQRAEQSEIEAVLADIQEFGRAVFDDLAFSVSSERVH